MVEPRVLIRVGADCTAHQYATIMDAIDALGRTNVSIDNRAEFDGRGGLGDIATIVELSAALTIAEFVRGFFGRAGAEGWDGLRSLVRRIRHGSGDTPTQVDVVAHGQDVTLTIDTRYPDAALDQLNDTTVDSLQRCTVYYDLVAGRWEIAPHPVLEDEQEA